MDVDWDFFFDKNLKYSFRGVDNGWGVVFYFKEGFLIYLYRFEYEMNILV